MLTISPELALAFEKATLVRWKTETAAQLRHRFPAAAARFPGAALENWVRDTMAVLRRAGEPSPADLERFTVTLFQVTEAAPDDRATADLLAIMLGDGAISQVETSRFMFYLQYDRDFC